MSRPNHIIQKQFLDINFGSSENGLALRNEVAEVFYEKLLPRMEDLFDELGSNDYSISFESLELNCGMLPENNWQEVLVEKTLIALRSELLAANKKKITEESKTENAEEALIFFLQHGHLPWNSSFISINELEVEAGIKLLNKLQELFQSHPSAIDRLTNNFSFEFIHAIIEKLAAASHVDSSAMSSIFLNSRLSAAKKGKAQAQLLKKICSEKVTLATKRKTGTQPIFAETETGKEEGLYINNAGIVILHPFLPELFNTLNLYVENNWVSELSQHTAVHILQYLATGSDEFPEFNLSLNKIICGMEPGEVLKAVDPISEETKNECDKLLQFVIHHWSALKNTGIEALREAFLQRFGKLTKVDHGWCLQVEPKAMDVLLGRLPWGISTARLPWMKGLLFTDW